MEDRSERSSTTLQFALRGSKSDAKRDLRGSEFSFIRRRVRPSNTLGEVACSFDCTLQASNGMDRCRAKALLDLHRGSPETHHGNFKRLSGLVIRAGVDVSPRHSRPAPLIDHLFFTLVPIKTQPLRVIVLALKSIRDVRIHADGVAASLRSNTRIVWSATLKSGPP